MNKKEALHRKPIQIRDRDRRILQALDDYGLLSTEQIKHLFFPSLSRARKRLHALWQHGLVRRIERPTRLGEGTKSLLFRGTAKGRRLAGLYRASNKPKSGSTSLSPLYAEHQLATNKFRICLELCLRDESEIKLKTWKPDGQLRLKTTVNDGVRTRSTTVVPDAYFSISQDGIAYGYFLEIDRGTAPVSRFRTKLLGYAAVFSNAKSFDPVIVPGFRVLIVTSTDRRRQNLLDLIQGLSGLIRRRDIFLVSVQDKFDYGAPGTVFGPIWSGVTPDGNKVDGISLQPDLRRSRQRLVNGRCADATPYPDLGRVIPGR